jgi:hypothetical protein
MALKETVAEVFSDTLITGLIVLYLLIVFFNKESFFLFETTTHIRKI